MRYDTASQLAVDYKAHQLNEQRRRRWRDVDEAASLHIHNANVSTERSYVSWWRLYPTVSGKKTSAIIQQAVFLCRKRVYFAASSSVIGSLAIAEKCAMLLI